MRDNGPVTGNAIEMREGDLLVSRTDLRGHITFANDAFVAISGFSREELIGQSHNLVRHPGMPAAAFADLWSTIQGGQCWVGLVKNRCKNGDHYWVRAAVSPVVENGAVTGFISVRTRPEAAAVDQAEQAYAAIAAGRGGLTVRRGRLRRTGPFSRLQAAIAPINRRILLVLIIILGLSAAGTAIGLNGFHGSNAALRDLVSNEMEGEANYAIALALMNDNWQRCIAASRPDGDIAAETTAISANIARINEVMAAQKATEMSAEEAAMNTRYAETRLRWRDQVLKPGLDLLAAGKRGQTAVLMTEQGLPILRDLSEQAQRYIALQKQQGAHAAEARERDFRHDTALSIALVGLSLTLGLVTLFTLPRTLSRNLRGLQSGMEDLANGITGTAVDLDRHDEFGPVNLALVALQTKLAYAQLNRHEQRAATMRAFDGTVGGIVSDMSGSIRSMQTTAGSQGTVAKQVAASAQTVAASASELNASIKEIASQASQVSSLAREAAQTAAGSRTAMAALAKAAHEITAVAKLIADIAEQTNLLALNATIEAARAGEVGRGFAVVAGEVKALANQTHGATGDINRKIAAVQSDSQAAATALESVAVSIGKLSDAAQAIAAAVEEQSAVVDEVARNAEQSAVAAKETGTGAEAVSTAATALAEAEVSLSKAIAEFKQS